jgi:hypothetical protein
MLTFFTSLYAPDRSICQMSLKDNSIRRFPFELEPIVKGLYERVDYRKDIICVRVNNVPTHNTYSGYGNIYYINAESG